MSEKTLYGIKVEENVMSAQTSYEIYVETWPVGPEGIDAKHNLHWLEVGAICKACERYKGVLKDVTKALGVTRHKLSRKLVKHGIPSLDYWRDVAARSAAPVPVNGLHLGVTDPLPIPGLGS